MTLEEYKNQLLDYLKKEKELTERDIQAHKNLSDEDKVEQGYLIKGCRVSKEIDGCYELTAKENNTKLRAGDIVNITHNGSNGRIRATIIENYFNNISLSTTSILDKDIEYDIHVTEAVLLEPLIQLLNNIEDGSSGAMYLKELFQLEEPHETGYRTINVNTVDIPDRLNDAQRKSIEKVLACPSLFCIQGPPGTGKTDVLSTIAKNFSEKGKEVLIVSNTHQAVNNALNKIAQHKHLPIVKIGESLKAQELSDNIQRARNYNDYLGTRPRSRRRDEYGAIVGMTLHAAIINLGLRNSGFSPSIVLADEAGQIPLTFGAAIGTFGAGTNVFIGDDRQMPPIFHPDLVNEALSVSIFSHLTKIYPTFKTVLDTTYRMNTEITGYVSKNFYEPYGITLKSFKRPVYNNSIEFISLTDDQKLNWRDYNPEEAKVAAEKALEYTRMSLEVAVVTPFRKQVNCIRECVKNLFTENGLSELPIVDTVERLQGQDVDVIIISTSVSDHDYYQTIQSFILEEHRLNVMFSRAKEKVIVVKSDIVQLE